MAGRDDGPASPDCLYAGVLGETWRALPEPIRRLHRLEDRLTAAGRARVERGADPVSRLIAVLIGSPPAADDVAVRVDFSRIGGVETWRRRFGDRAFVSRQEGGADGLLVERFGPAAFAMRLAWDGRRLGLEIRRWSLFGVPMPMALGPRTRAWEEVVDGRFAFFVELRHPLGGLIVRYQGWLEPV